MISRIVNLQRKCSYQLIIIFLILITTVLYLTKVNKCKIKNSQKNHSHILPYFNKFKLANNTLTNTERPFIVPDIVHFLRFNESEFTFLEACCILSAVQNEMPDKLFIHTNMNNFTGQYWDYLLNNKNFKNIYKIKRTIIPKSIFYQKFHDHNILHHSSDIVRLRILRQYGGIFLDNDSYIVKNLDKFRKMEMSVGWDRSEHNIGTQILVAHPDARFLQLWVESYRDHYEPDLWYYNAGDRPFQTVLAFQPNLIYNASEEFGVRNMYRELFHSHTSSWRNYYAIHLLQNHRDYLDPTYKKFKIINEKNVCFLRNTLGEMLRFAYYGSNLCPGKLGKMQKKRNRKLKQLRLKKGNNSTRFIKLGRKKLKRTTIIHETTEGYDNLVNTTESSNIAE